MQLRIANKILKEVTILSEDLELSENTIIQNKKVVLDMMTIQTLQHDLTIIAEEFISNHSFIQSFPEGQTAKEKEDGRSGGHVLIKAKIAKGSLGLTFKRRKWGLCPYKANIKKRKSKTFRPVMVQTDMMLFTILGAEIFIFL